MIGNLTLDQLRVLVTVADTGGFSAAGRKLLRVQSAISQTVQSLEAAQGVQIFDRSGHKPKVTPAGEALVRQARQILHQAGRFETLARDISSGMEPELALAVDSLVPTQPLIDSLAALNRQFPELPVTLYLDAAGGVERRLRNGTAILALCALFPTVAQDLQALPLLPMNLIPVAAAGHELSSISGPVSREILSEHVQLVLTDAVDPSGPSHSFVSSRIWRFVDQGQRLSFLLAGLGWGNLPAHRVQAYLQDGRLKRLDVEDPAVTPGSIMIYAVHCRDQPLRKAGAWLLADLRARLAGGGPAIDGKYRAGAE